MKRKIILAIVVLIALAVAAVPVYMKVMSSSALKQIQKAETDLGRGAFAECVAGLDAVRESYFARGHAERIDFALARACAGLGLKDRLDGILERLGKSESPEYRQFSMAQKAEAARAAGDEDGAVSMWKVIAAESVDTLNKASALLGIARATFGKGFYIESNDALSQILQKYPNTPDMEEVMDLYGKTNMKLLFAKTQTPNSEFYLVNPGDTLPGIAKQFGMTVDFLAAINGIRNGNIRPGHRLKIIKGTFSIQVDKSLCVLTLFLDGRFIRNYHVGTGKMNSTPVGEFYITNKLKEPTWYKPDGGIADFGSEDNLLGTRWMGINYPGYGIHGTWARDTIGQQSSAGCIRLLNEEVEELYMILPEGTKVTIVD